MKVPVVSKQKKIATIILLIILWLCEAAIILIEVLAYLEDSKSDAYEFSLDAKRIVTSVIIVIITISSIITLTSNVVIDDKGITLRRGALEVNHFSWDKVCRVETFEALYRRSLIFGDRYITVLNTSEASWAYSYRRMPINLGAKNISFAYDSQAFDLIKKYYKGNICS